MRDCTKFYIDGQWIEPAMENTVAVENPATEETIGHISFGSQADVDKAVTAARRAFESFSQTSREERLTLLRAIQAEIENRKEDLATAVSDEMGAPMSLANGPHVGLLAGHCQKAIEILENFAFERQDGPTLHVWEPIGVVGMITPWNWPLNQIACKVFPALATGNTMVLKPSEIAPFNGYIFAEIMDAAGVPAGVFNLVNGDGPGVGEAISGHPDIDMVSFTGSTRAGIAIAKNAADTVKRVAQELGGKSPNIVLDDSAFTKSVAKGTVAMMGNSGQTCTAASRMLVPRARMEEAKAAAKEAAESVVPGDPKGNAAIGPVVSRTQWDKIQGLIEKGVQEGATLVAGGPGKPEGLETGHYVKPTVFADVTNDMTIAREEIFGPVLCILGYEDYDDAVRIANDTEYGLASAVTGEDIELARSLAKRIRAGRVAINGGYDMNAAFGGYKKSGNGREWGEWGFHDFLEVKAIMGTRLMAGRYFDQWQVGDRLVHEIRRTVTEADNLFFTVMTHNPQPLHLDAEAAKASEFGRILVNGTYTFSLMVGLSVGDTTLGTLVANLGYDKLVMPKPVFIGDTLHATSEIIGLRESKSRPDAGIVTFLHEAVNQRDETVCRCERSALLKKASAGESA